MPAAFLMPFSIFKRTSGACPVHPPPPLPGGWQTFVLAGRVSSPLPLLRSPLCTVYIIMLKFVVPHNIFSVFLCSAPRSSLRSPLQPVLLAFWTGTATGIFRLPPLHPLAPSLPHLFLHVFLWPRRELAHSSQLQLQLLRALIFPDYFFCSITFLWPGAGRDSTSSSSSSAASFWPFYA